MLNTLRILIVEDQKAMSDTLNIAFRQLLRFYPDALIVLAPTLTKAKQYLAEEPPPDVVILDIGLPDSVWRETLSEVPDIETRAGVIIVTGHPVDEVRTFLDAPNVEIVHKDCSMWHNLIVAFVRLFERRSKHLQRADECLTEVRQLLHGTSTT